MLTGSSRFSPGSWLSVHTLILFMLTVASSIGGAFAGQISLAWDASTGATGYKVYYGQTSGSYSANLDAGNSTTYTVPSLTNGASYYFAVTSYNASGVQSGFSNQISATVPSIAAPVASFAATTTSGTAPMTVTFTDTSTGTISSRSWDLGDGSTATGAIVSKSYSTAGTYVVNLSVTNSGGSSKASKTVTVTSGVSAPVADFSASPTSGPAPLTVAFVDSSTVTATAWSWQFGDGGSSTAKNPSHTYTAAGTYNVTLTATGSGGGGQKTRTGYITVAAPIAGGGTAGKASGLVAAYSFDEAGGTPVVDASGNANHGVIEGAARIGSGRAGYGNALNLNGTNNRVTVNDSASLDLTTGMTTEAWVYPTAWMSSWRAILVKEDGAATIAYYLYANNDTNQPLAGARISGYSDAVGITQLPAYKWSHVAGTYDGQYVRLYINSVLVTQHAQTGSIPVSTDALRIGGNAIWGEYFAGYLDDIRIYNRALSQTEVAADANTPVSVTSPAQFKLGENTVQALADNDAAGTAEAFSATAGSSGTLTNVQVYLDTGSTATTLTAGIYTDLNGHPGSLVAKGALGSLGAGAWNSVALPATSVTYGQRYWIAILGTNGQLRFRDHAAGGGATETSASTTLSSLPNSWTTGSVYSNGPMSAYGAGY